MPKPHELVSNHDGLKRFRPEFDALRIEPRAFGGRRIVVSCGDRPDVVFDLSSTQVAHLVELLRN